MTRIALERPDLKPTEVLAAAVLAHNEMERLRGFSLSHWALGRAPNWINHSSTAATKRQIRAFWNMCKDGNSQRCVAEGTQRRTTEEGISSKKQTRGTFQTWRRSGLMETRQRQRCATTHTSKAGFTGELWCWRRARTSMKKTDLEIERSSG